MWVSHNWMCDQTMTNNKMDVSGDKHRMDVTQGVVLSS